MAAIQRTLILISVAAISFLAGCGSSHSTTSQQQNVTIAVTPDQPISLIVGDAAGVSFTPSVSNDPANDGVDWALTCPASTIAASCGTLTIPPDTTQIAHSASGTAVTYTPPTLAYDSNGQISTSMIVNVTVFATADHTQNKTIAVTVGSYASALSGTYVFQVQGGDSVPLPYQITGALLLDGQGAITAGRETVNTLFDPLTSVSSSALYTLWQGSGSIPSTYFIGPDGRGTISLNLVDHQGNPYHEQFTLEVISKSKALIAELDGQSAVSLTAPVTGSGVGTLELQDPAAVATQPTGAYAFVTGGTDANSADTPIVNTPAATAIGGIFNIDNMDSHGNACAGCISGNGSLADQDYYNTKGTVHQLQSCVPPTGVTGTVSSPDSLGVVTIVLTGDTCFGLVQPASIQFTGYIVDATHIKLIESDDVDGTSGFLTAGVAVSQGSAAGTFSNASLSGSYVFGVLGVDVATGATPASFTAAGVLQANSGNMDGEGDFLFQGAGIGVAPAARLTGSTYTVDTYAGSGLGLGRALVNLAVKAPSKPHPSLLLYLTGDAKPPLVLYAGGENGPNFRAIGTGIAYPQAVGSSQSFVNNETYGVNFTQQNGSENDGSGRSLATINGITGALSGTGDDVENNSFLTQAPFFILNDTFTLPSDSFGLISGTFSTDFGVGPADYFLIDGNSGFFVENDLAISGQVALGYFAQACDVTNATSCQ